MRLGGCHGLIIPLTIEVADVVLLRQRPSYTEGLVQTSLVAALAPFAA
jgi:hypothetical protein